MDEVLSVLSSLLKATPSFWGVQEAKSVSALYVDGTIQADGALATSIDKFAKLLTKQISSKVILTALVQSWPTVTSLGTSVSF